MSKFRLVDLHCDAITKLPHKNFLKYISKAQKSGVEAIAVSVWTTQMQNPMEQIKQCRRTIDSIDTNIKLLLHIEDAWFLTKQNIDELIGYKPYSVGLTWNENNNLAGGALGNGKLTKLGKVIIEKLTASGIHIDLAHLNRKSFSEVAKILQTRGKKLLCTHTCFDEVKSHPRNLDRKQIQAIVNSGGLIGLTLVGDFLTSNKRATMQDVYNHITYFLKNFGDDNIAIGTDFHGTKNLPKGLKKYNDFNSLQKFLLKKGLKEETVSKIFAENFK